MMNPERNIHHFAYPRCLYDHGHRKRFRDHELMRVEIPVVDHNNLHSEVYPNQIIPTNQLLIASLGHIALLEDLQPAELVDELATYFWDEGATELAKNLYHQMPYLDRATYKD